MSHDSYHLREESADELEASGDELDRSAGDELDRSVELDRSTGDELERSVDELLLSEDEVDPVGGSGVGVVDRKVFETVLHIDEDKLMAEVRGQEVRGQEVRGQEVRGQEVRDDREREEHGEVDGKREGGAGEVKQHTKPGLQETSFDDVMSPVHDDVTPAAVTSPGKEDMTSSVSWDAAHMRKVEVEIVEKEQEKVYNRTPSVEKPPPYNFSRSESEGNDSTANERVNGSIATEAPSDSTTTVPTTVVANDNQRVTNGNGNEIPYVLHRRHVEKQQQQANGRPSRPLQKQHTEPALQRSRKEQVSRQQRATRDQARLQLEQIKTDLRTPIVPSSKRSPRDKSPGSGLVRVRKLPPRDSYSYKDDTVSPESEKEIISQITIHAKYPRSRSEEHKKRRRASPPPEKRAKSPPPPSSQAYTPREKQLQKVQHTTVQQVHTVQVTASSPSHTVSQKSASPATPQKPKTSPKPGMTSSKKQPSPKHKALNDLNKPSPPKKPPRTSSNVESGDLEAKLMKLIGLHRQNLVPPKVPPKAEMEDLTPTTDTDSDSSGGTGRRRGQPMRGHVRNTSQTDPDVNRILSDGGEAAESSSLVSSGSSPGKVATPGGTGSPGRVSSTSSVEAGSPAKKVDSPVCEESFSAMKGQDLPFADSIPHFSDDDDDNDDDGTVGKTLESDVSEEDLEEQLNVPGLEQEEFSDMEPVGGSPMYPGSPARRRGTTTTATTQPQEGPLPPPVPSCPPPLSDISSDSEPERPTDEGLPEILLVPGVTDLPPPAPSFDLLSDDETEEQPGYTEDLPPPKLSPNQQEAAGKQSGKEQPGTTGTQSGGLSPGEPRQITAIPEEPLQYKISPSQPPPVTKFKYVRSDSDVPPPPPPVELLQASAMHEISSKEEVEMPQLEHEDLPDLEAQLAAGQVVIPPPVAPTELSSGSDEAETKEEEDVVDLDQALSASSRIVGQLVAAEFHTAHGTTPDNVQELPERNGAINTQEQPERKGTKHTQGQIHEISSESDVCEGDRAEEMEDLEAALCATGRRGMAPPSVEISSEEDVRYPEEDEDLHGDIQEALREGRTIVPGTGAPHAPPPLDVSSGDSDPGQPDDESLPEIDQFEKKFELHIEEDEESVTCLPEGAEHMITPLEGAGVESLSSSGAGGRRSSGSTSSESALEMKGAVGAMMGGMVSTAGLPLQISSESEGEEGAGGVPPPDDLPDPMDVLEANVVLANPYMMGDDEFSEHPQELPPPPPPPGALQHLPGAHEVTSTTATTSIINQYYGAAAPGSMQTSGPMGAQRRQPPKVPPKPPTRNSSSMQPAVESGGQGVPTRAGYDALHGGEDSDSSGAGGVGEGAAPQEDGDVDRLEALEALRHPYIVHRSDSSGSDRQDVSDSDDSTSDSEEDFEEIPESIIRTRQLGRHHVGLEVARNRRYRNQVNIQVSNQVSNQDTVSGNQQHHIYQNVSLSGEPLVQQPDTGQQASDPGHIYQNLRATVSHSNGMSATRGSSSSEGAYQPLRPLTVGSQTTQQEGPSQGARSPQAEVFSNPYAESFGAQISPAAAAAHSSGEVTSSRSPSSRSSQGHTRSRAGAGRSGRANQSDSD